MPFQKAKNNSAIKFKEHEMMMEKENKKGNLI